MKGPRQKVRISCDFVCLRGRGWAGSARPPSLGLKLHWLRARWVCKSWLPSCRYHLFCEVDILLGDGDNVARFLTLLTFPENKYRTLHSQNRKVVNVYLGYDRKISIVLLYEALAILRDTVPNIVQYSFFAYPSTFQSCIKSYLSAVSQSSLPSSALSAAFMISLRYLSQCRTFGDWKWSMYLGNYSVTPLMEQCFFLGYRLLKSTFATQYPFYVSLPRLPCYVSWMLKLRR